MDDPKGKGYREDERSNVEAENCEQVAGRDIHNDNREQRLQFILQMILAAADPSPPPNPDSPHLDDCPHCGRRWVSRLALFCPTCGFSAQAHRIAARRRSDIRFTLHAMTLFCGAPLAISAAVATLGFQVSQQMWAAGGFYAIVGVIAWVVGYAFREPRALTPHSASTRSKT